jgi:mannose-6-phosphate isomerase-like protein (cupin superfamily)
MRAMTRFTGNVIAGLLVSSLAMAQGAASNGAADGGITVWENGVPPGGIAQKVDFGDHLLEISHREANGRAELHKVKADVMVIQTGHATLVTGDEVIDPKGTGPNEIQGSGIKGGVKHEVGPGDIIEVPAGVPHQFFLEPDCGRGQSKGFLPFPFITW